MGWGPRIYQSNYGARARGGAIIIKKNVSFEHRCTVSDPNGRFIIVSGTLNSAPVTLINVYGPNFDDPAFFPTVLNGIPDVGNTNIIMGGDINCVLNSLLDKQSQRLSVNIKSSEELKNTMKNLHLVDIWRLLNPTARDYSFFSPVHKSYSRIDFMLLDSKLISSVATTQYHNILISDHAAMSLDIRFNNHKSEHTWRFDNTILKEKSFLKYMSDRLPNIIATNDTGDVDDSVLWESIKAVRAGSRCVSARTFIQSLRRPRHIKLYSFPKR